MFASSLALLANEASSPTRMSGQLGYIAARDTFQHVGIACQLRRRPPEPNRCSQEVFLWASRWASDASDPPLKFHATLRDQSLAATLRSKCRINSSRSLELPNPSTVRNPALGT